MQKIIETLTQAVSANLNATLEPAAFLKYAQAHPWLINVLAASRNHGEITSPILEANGFPNPKEFRTKKRDMMGAFLDLSSEFRELAIWLVSAARIFQIRVLGFSLADNHEKTKNLSKAARRKIKSRKLELQSSFRKSSKRRKIDLLLKKKAGMGLVAYITYRYKQGQKPNSIDREIAQITRVKWSVGNSRNIIVANHINR